MAVGKAGNSNTMIMAGEALKQLLLVRLNVNKLLGRHEQSSADGAEKALAALKTAMTAFGAGIVNDDVRKVFADVNSNVEKYTEAYHKAAHNAHEIEALANGEMSKIAQAIGADAEAIKESGVAEEKQIEHETDEPDRLDRTSHSDDCGGQPVPGHRARVVDRTRDLQTGGRTLRRDARTGRGQFPGRPAGSWPRRRSRRHGAGGRNLQDQGRGEGPRRGRSQDEAGSDRRAATQGGHDQAGRSASKARSARSSRPCPRPRPNSRLPPRH